MAHPTTKVEIAFTDGPFVASPTWTDVTSYVRDATVSRGRASDREPFGQSHATVTLNNTDRRFDPLNLAGPHVEAAVPESFNLIPNVLFESALDSNGNQVYYNTDQWATASIAMLDVATATDPFGLTGKYVLLVTTFPVPQVGLVYTESFTVSPSTAYTASIYLKRRDGVTTPPVRIGVQWYDAANIYLSKSESAYSNISSSWQRRSVTATAPSNAAFALFYVEIDSTEVIDFDLIYPMVEASATLNDPWFAPSLLLSPSVYGARQTYEFLGYNSHSTMRRIPYAAQTLLRPRVQIRITADAGDGGGYRAVFRGYISGFPVNYTMAGKHAITTLDCFDLFGLLAVAEVQPDWAEKFWGFGYRGNDPEGSGVITYANRAVYMTQVAGTTPFKLIDPLASNLPNEAISLGAGNTWRAAPRVETGYLIGNQGIEIGMWWAKGVPNTASTPFVVGTDNRHYEFHVTAAGQIRVRIYNTQTSTYDQLFSATSEFNSFIPHHIMLIRDFLPPFGGSGDPILYVDGVDVTATKTSGNAGASPYAFTVGNWEQVADDVFQEFAWRFKPTGSAVLTAAQVNQIYGVAVDKLTESSSARFTRIMQQTSVPAALYTFLGTAEASVSAIGMGGAISPQLDTLCESEGGHLFVSKSGVLTMTHRSYAAGKASGTPSAQFNDQGAYLRYGTEFSVEHTADEMLNEVQVNYSGDGGITISNASSKTVYGSLSETLETQLATQQAAIDLATYTQRLYGSVIPRISALEVSVANTAADWATLLSLELLDAFTFIAHPVQGTTISKTLTVQQIEHRITPKIWETSIRGSSRYSGWFVLDKSSLDGPDVLL